MKPQHKALIVFSLLLCALMAMLQSCTPQQKAAMYEKKLAAWCAQCKDGEKKETTITETPKDTTVPIAPDASKATATVNCDSLQELQITQLKDSLGRISKVILTVTKTEEKAKGGGKKYVINAECIVDSQAIYIQWKERNKETVTTVTLKIPTYIEKKLTWWEKIKIDYGGWAIAIIALFLLYLLIRLGWFIFKLTPYGAAFNVPSVLSRFVR